MFITGGDEEVGGERNEDDFDEEDEMEEEYDNYDEHDEEVDREEMDSADSPPPSSQANDQGGEKKYDEATQTLVDIADRY